MTFESSVRTERNGSVLTVIIDRPARRNAIDERTAELLHQTFIDFDHDPDCDVAVLSGAGGYFSAGGDLHEVAGTSAEAWLSKRPFPEVDEEARSSIAPLGPTRLVLSKPVIAAVSGAAVAGGMELALWCDLRVVEETAYFGNYARRFGLAALDGATVRLPRLVGSGRAADILMTGRRVDAEEALRIGMCEYVVPEGFARVRAEELAQQIACTPQDSLRADRRSLIEQDGLSLVEALRNEYQQGRASLVAEGVSGSQIFASGEGRGGTRLGSSTD
jgi:enoyl-CoA hydratase